MRALDQGQDGQHVIEFAGSGGLECLDREAATAATPEILKTYGIPSDRRL